jgi:glyoxylase-like metal-dependent hydrolase (beta-lactamase superfamily II)
MRIKRLIVGEIQTNCYLILNRDEVAVIDPGGDADKILQEIAKFKPASLKYIINTHYHYDHILVNEEIKQKTGAKIVIHKAEKNFINFKIDKFLEEGDRINIGNNPPYQGGILKVIHTPGHTKGSICLLGDNFVFSGDTVFKDGYGRTDLAGGSQKELENSLDKLNKIIKPGMTVYPGHGEIFKY